MKRIIQCPHCETKLSVFDIGKPISQKCPKCGKSFTVASEKASSGGQIDDKNASTAVTSSATDNKSQPSVTVSKDNKLVEAKDKGADYKESSETQPVADTARPDVTADLDTLPAHEPAGSGGLFKAFAIGALLVIIVMQLITKRNSDRQYNMLNENLKTIAKKLGN